MPTRSDIIRTYIRAKDENRPHLMISAFAETATLDMVVKTGAIAFPPVCDGINAITRVLVQDFGKTFENVYTFCLARPPEGNDATFSCRWLVGMSAKDDGAVRIGCGRYDWQFETRDPGLVEKLTITIESMLTLSPDGLRPAMNWLSSLPYPWCLAEEAIGGMPHLEGLEAVRNTIGQ